MTVLILIAWILAVARLTRLVTRDKITEPIRAALIQRLGTGSQLTYLVHCAWCTSVWVAFTTAPAAVALAGLSWWLLPLLALAASQLVGMLATADPVDTD
ncbi:DUF1360 domain-containing protein [Nocardia sp. CDC159]|uniref:DUF1360 domain-containing protein n=1 Tax=Nocardia pulmonis TaxID=2951408 RepID=A0A9X2E7E1_9NOCA|nr:MULTISPECIES: DUF1360 domain-containing protein [Nocardia]MCM6774996.1 DUF1360 domain-containing protein [Nocardia pulmonis]MCM6789927.1 DUF1360 domain-containing protein [Nocardia sp. CDC159]